MGVRALVSAENIITFVWRESAETGSGRLLPFPGSYQTAGVLVTDDGAANSPVPSPRRHTLLISAAFQPICHNLKQKKKASRSQKVELICLV